MRLTVTRDVANARLCFEECIGVNANSSIMPTNCEFLESTVLREAEILNVTIKILAAGRAAPVLVSMVRPP